MIYEVKYFKHNIMNLFSAILHVINEHLKGRNLVLKINKERVSKKKVNIKKFIALPRI